MSWEPTAEQKRIYEERGYFTVENVIPRQTATEMLGVIKNAILTPEMGDIRATLTRWIRCTTIRPSAVGALPQTQPLQSKEIRCSGITPIAANRCSISPATSWAMTSC